MLSDLRHAVRVLAKSPGFTLAAILVLGLGIGLNTAMFSVLHAFAFSPRPFPEPERVWQLYTQDEQDAANFRAFSYPAYRELRERHDLFTGLLAHNPTTLGVGEGRDSRRTLGALISANYFEVLGVPLARGRPFTAQEEKPGADLPVAIASHQLWRKHGLRPDFVGSTLHLNGRPFTIVGITPEHFSGTMSFIGCELYCPLGVFDSLHVDFAGQRHQRLDLPDSYQLILVGRLQPGLTLAAADAALAGVADSFEALHPVAHRQQNFRLGPLPRFGTSPAPVNENAVGTLSALLLGLTGLVLLVVCLNLATMLLARGHARRKEFAIRLALGGSRGRIIRQLLTEGGLLALAGGALGLLLASEVTDLLLGAVTARVPVALFFDGATGPIVLGATLGFCALATVFFAFGPALKFSRGDVLTDLKGQTGEGAVRRSVWWRPRHPLVVAQLALSLALLIVAGLFARFAETTINLDPGYHADDTLVAEVDASLGGHDEARARELYRAAEARLAALPGVQSASLGALAPFGLENIHRSLRRAGTQPPPDARPATAAEGLAISGRWNAIGADYFATMSLPLLQGRTFTRAETDIAGAPPVVIIDEVLAKRLWPGGDALGQHVQWADQDFFRGSSPRDDAARVPATMEIVGIVRATRDDIGQREPGRAIYVPFAQGFMNLTHFHVRPAVPGEAAALALRDSVRRALQAAAPGVPVFKVQTFGQHRAGSMEAWAARMAATLFLTFSAFAGVIAVIGIYGVNAYTVSRRTREIGIRLALGAEPTRVRDLLLRESLGLTLAGLVGGLFLGGALAQVFASLFVNFDGTAPLVIGLCTITLFSAAMLACLGPARRATRVDPIEALRAE